MGSIKFTGSTFLYTIGRAHTLGMSYYVNFLGGLGGNEFHIKGRFGTIGS